MSSLWHERGIDDSIPVIATLFFTAGNPRQRRVDRPRLADMGFGETAPPVATWLVAQSGSIVAVALIVFAVGLRVPETSRMRLRDGVR